MREGNAKSSVRIHFRHILLRMEPSDRTTPLRMRGNIDVGEGVCDRRDEATPHLQKRTHARRSDDDQRTSLQQFRPLLVAFARLLRHEGRKKRQQERETQVMIGVRVTDDDPPNACERRHSFPLHSQQLVGSALAAVEENSLGRHREEEAAH